MSDTKTQIKLMKAIVNADMTKAEIKLVIHFLTKYDKYFIVENTKLSEETSIKIPNLIRTIKDLKDKNVIKYREFGNAKIKKAYITLFKDWQSKSKK